MSVSISSLFLSALLLQAAPATSPSTVPVSATSTEVATLITQLGSDDVGQRDAAQRALLAAGDDVLPALQAARRDARDADVQLRLDTLLVQVQERVDIGATRVTLQFTDTPLNVVLDALAKQARTDFGGTLLEEFGGTPLPKLTLDLRDVSFWQAIQAIQDAANIAFLPQAEGWRASRNFGQGTQLRGSESGAFLVQPMMASYQRNISYARDGGDGEYFSFQFQALAEPKIRLAMGVGTMQLERVVDSNGNDLLAAQRTQQVSTGNGQNTIVCGVPLKYPKNAGDRIAEVSGTLRISIARRFQVISSDDLLGKGKVQDTVEGVKVTITPTTSDAQAARAGVAFSVTLEGPENGTVLQRMQQNLQQQLRVVDSRGVALRLSNFTPTRSEPRVCEYQAAFIPMQPGTARGPYKVRVEIPTGFREIEVPFSMRDLKMP